MHQTAFAGAELVGERQEQANQSLLMLRLQQKNVEADALGLARLVQEPVTLGLFQGSTERFSMKRLEREGHPRAFRQMPRDTCLGSAEEAEQAAQRIVE